MKKTLKRIDAITDKDIAAGIAKDSDAAPVLNDLSDFKPAIQFLKERAGRGPQISPTKERITIRLSPEVLEYYRATGKGWQSRIDQALKETISGVDQ
ncbi:MAG: BrnA antitoxin family protein [Pseudomonadales bacterium]|nr:BrnA antitoxin family protein [Pseudomonadales bacterium]MCP5358269.1 BrnA antitoxin family protein [Pseudomonadales bacterium]